VCGRNAGDSPLNKLPQPPSAAMSVWRSYVMLSKAAGAKVGCSAAEAYEK
jgi:hypothetical protein